MAADDPVLQLSRNVATVTTDTFGLIYDANHEAEQLLCCRWLAGRNLLVFFDGNRARWTTEIEEALSGMERRQIIRVRPKEHRAIPVLVTVTANGPWQLRWTLELISSGSGSPPSRQSPA